jgi:CRP-like cAMP-binding protein
VSTNKLLARLSGADAKLLEPYLERVELPVRKQLQAPNRRVERIYFLESGLASIVVGGEHPIEIGIIGREGMTGISVLLGNSHRVLYEAYMQIAGEGRHLPAHRLCEAIAESATLHMVFLRYVHDFLTQTMQTAAANGRSKIEERLARWLVMAQDRLDGNEVKLTHDVLAVMLGVRRSGVTTALHELEHKGLIVLRRSLIVIIDRAGLEEACNGAYVPPDHD